MKILRAPNFQTSETIGTQPSVSSSSSAVSDKERGSRTRTSTTQSERASVLIIVMWITFGLVALALYFGHSMSFELRASDNRVASVEAQQAIEGAVRYVSFVLSNNPDGPGSIPEPQAYQAEAVTVGDAKFWLIGRTNADVPLTTPYFGLIDEASKLNLNFADSNMLSLLPGMTGDIAASIIAWRSTNMNTGGGGAESDTYQRMSPPYLCKNAPFETVDELRLIYGMNMLLLYGEDANLNGILDPNENDGDKLPPSDNQDGHLDPGLLEYVTVYSREPNVTSNGTARVNITTLTDPEQLMGVLTNSMSESRAEEVMGNAGYSMSGGGGPGPGGPGGGRGGGPAATPTFTSILQFYIASKMTPQEFAAIEGQIRGSRVQGLINVNTASAAVLACLPGLDSGTAGQLVSYRLSNPNNLNSVAWVSQVLDQQTATTVGPWLTGKSYQFTADVAAVGHHGRGYQRIRFVFDTTQSAPIVLYRQDLTHLGWALGKQVRDQLQMVSNTR